MVLDMPAPSAVSVDWEGNTTFEQDADTFYRPASTVKLMTGYLTFEWVTDLDQTVTVVSSDIVSGTTAQLQVDDIFTVRDLLYGLMLPSGNDAARCLGRHVGQIILDAENGSGDPLDRFVTEMNVTASGWGWTGAELGTPSGYPDTISTMNSKHLVDMLRQIAVADSPLIGVAGTRSWQASVGGPNARTVTYTNTTNPDGAVKFPEYLAAKTGWAYSTGNLVMMWEHPDGSTHFSAIMGSPSTAGRFVSMRAVINEVIGASLGGLRVGGRRVSGLRVGGRDAVAAYFGAPGGSVLVWHV